MVLPAKTSSSPPDAIREERAARLAAMFQRWNREDVTDEPDWDPNSIVRFGLAEQDLDLADESSSKRR